MLYSLQKYTILFEANEDNDNKKTELFTFLEQTLNYKVDSVKDTSNMFLAVKKIIY